MLLLARLKQLLSYEPQTGVFRWKVRPPHSHVQVGDRAGSVYSNGYRYIQIDGQPYRSGRLAWLYVTGVLPDDYIDHENLNKSDDRFDNLRPATNQLNQANRGLMMTNTSGHKGVRWEASRGRWRAAITIDGKAKNLGRFFKLEEAKAAYEAAAVAAWGEFART